MDRLPLIGGAYSARSPLASAERAVNYYPEINPKDALTPTTHYQRPGLVERAQPEVNPVRALYRASDMNQVKGVWKGHAYGVVGSNVYSIAQDFTTTKLGSITPGLVTPVSFTDNGIDVVIVDGSPNGWQIDFQTNTMTPIADPTGTFIGADRTDYIDSFIVFNQPDSKNWYSTLSNEIKFDPTYVAAKTGYPDQLESLIVNRHEILLMGALKAEIWFDSGDPLFPFAQLPGAYIEHGLAAKYSLAAQDINVYWLHQDLQGRGMVLKQKGYETTRISNHALEYAIRKIAAGAGISDAIGYCYQQDGHVFYVLHFPAGDQTWVYDEAMSDSTLAWHQEAWTDNNGVLHRHRGNCFANLWGKNCVGDWQNGKIYEMDPEEYQDDGKPITCIRTFPHIGQGRMAGSPQPVAVNGRRMTINRFWLDLECGRVPLALDGQPRVGLRWSTDKGRTWGNTVLQSAGEEGQFVTQPQWGPIGQGRDILFEISHSLAGASALNGAWIDTEIEPT